MLQKLVTGLTPGASYSFQVLGYNFNGAGQTWSQAASYTSCVVPSGVPVPNLTEQRSTHLSFEWNAPDYDGGCPITTY